ncbi:MAG: right-handed parallel beta-helix repeat-containing protein, partial [Planctomycetota bacterium]
MKKLAFTLICLLLIPASQAGTITVDDDGPADFAGIGEAINASEGGDVIIVGPGTYEGNISFNNRAITLTSENPDDPNTVAATIISADVDYSVSFDFDEGNNSVLTGFTITGRGIRCYGTSPTISKNIITDCSNYGIYGENDAAPIISDNTITSNALQGIYFCNGPITNNLISGNAGGIAYCHGPITGNVITDNSETDFGRGGGLSFCRGPITGNIVAYNYAIYKGGACYECTGEITGNIFVANSSNIAGGALCNCRGRIANNIITGNISDSGGGLFGCIQVYNNAIAGNKANVSGGAMSQCPGYVSNNIIAHNRATSVGGIEGASISSYNAFWSNEGANFAGGATAGAGDMVVDPLFAADGYWDPNGTPETGDDFWIDGDYHLKSQAGRWDPNDRTWIADTVTSPCVDAGNPASSWARELWPHGRRVNIGAYGGTVEASISLSDAGNIANLDPDPNDTGDWVDRSDLALFAAKWLSTEVPCREDFDASGVVDFADYAILISNWLPEPPAPVPPTPDPAVWAVEPEATSRTTIAMTAAVATSTDESGVQYYFHCTTAGGHDSSWQDGTEYTDTGLTANTTYSYMVKARNKGDLMETAYSTPAAATTSPEDSAAPTPDPATWATEPVVSSASTIRMVATTASDESGVEYYFECTSNAAYSSGWQDSPTYQVTSLPKGTYSFKVRARDKSPNRN